MTTPAGPRIGSLFSGYGGLDLGVQEVLGGHVVWHSQYEPPDKHGKADKHQYAARILAHHWPAVPNLGDITAVDWAAVLDEHGPIDILTGGFPCTDVSLAGRRAGLTEGTRSGLWSHMARAISILKPRLVVIENVRGLLSADAHGDVEPCPWCLGDGPDEPVLRALGAVLGDLAGLGFDASWQVLRASDVGACHQRERVIALAWPADAEGPGLEGAHAFRRRVSGDGAAPTDAADLGHERGRGARDGRGGPADCGDAASDAKGGPRRLGDGDDVRTGGAAVGHGEAAGSGAVADADSRRCEGHPERDSQADDGQPERQPLLDADGRGLRREAPADPGRGGQRPGECDVLTRESDAEVRSSADAESQRRGEGGAEPARIEGRPDAPVGGTSNWGAYGPAIAQWEHILGRPAPRPTDDLGRLNPAFVEWMMGLPAGHVTDVPGLPRSAQLKALGNGVVPAQCAAALRLLLARTPSLAGAFHA